MISDNLSNFFQKIKKDKEFCLPVTNNNSIIGFLKPITFFDIENDSIIKILKDWRNQNIGAYLDQRKVTLKGTRKWLADHILKNPTKILFFLNSVGGIPIGHMGLANGLKILNSIEVDNIVRGKTNFKNGLITLALNDLITWAFNFSGYQKIYLRVFSDNTRAINMYNKLRFKEMKKYALGCKFEKNIKKFFILDKDIESEKYFSYMELQKVDHFFNYKNIKDYKKK